MDTSSRADTKVVRKDILSMIIPISIEGVLQTIASTIVMGMIGRLDVFSINAWSVTNRLTNLFWAFARGIGLGITISVANDLGAENRQRIKQTAVCAICMLFAIGLFFSGVVALLAPQIISMFGGDAEMNVKAVVVTRICCIGIPFWSVIICTSGILQGHGNAKVPMVIMTVYNFAVAGIGSLLIFGGAGLPRMELAGAAWTVVITQVVMFFVCLLVLVKYGILNDLKKAGLTAASIRENISRLFRNGFPPAVENLLWQLGSIAMLRPTLSYGDYPYAAFQLGMQAEAISYMPTMGFSVATSSLVSRSFGVNKPDRAELYFKQIQKYMKAITIVLIAVLVLARIPLMSMLTDDPELISLGAIYLITVAVTLLPQNLYGVYAGAIRGSGSNKIPLYISFIGLWIVRVPLCYISAYLIPNTTIIWIWVAMELDLVTRFVLGKLALKRSNIFAPREPLA